MYRPGRRRIGSSASSRRTRRIVCGSPTSPTFRRWSAFLYLAIVLDVFSRRVVGWAMATHLRTELVVEALEMAVEQRRPEAVVHHSDQGCQYTSLAFGGRCREWGVALSMGSVGDCFDCACYADIGIECIMPMSGLC